MAFDLTGTGRAEIRRKKQRRMPSIAAVEALDRRLLLSATIFGAPVTTQIALGDFPAVATAVGDLNGDTIPDLIVARDNLQAQVYLGAATGVLAANQIVATGGNFIALADFNGDTNLDLATANGIYPGLGNGTFGTVIGNLTLPSNIVNLYAQDVNGDGNMDLVAATYSIGTGTGNNVNPTLGVSVLLGNGNGTFAAAISTTIGSQAGLSAADASLGFADFNNDTKLDLVSPMGVMLGNNDGTFAAPLALPFKMTGTNSVAVNIPAAPLFALGDFNGDGNIDIATIPATSNTGQIELFLGKGTGAFTDSGPITVVSGDIITTLTPAAISGGANADLLAGVVTPAGVASIALLANSGAPSFGTPTLYSATGAPVSIVAVDFNGDSTFDLLSIDQVAGSTTTTTATGQSLAVTASVMLSSSQALPAPQTTLVPSTNPVVSGSPVKYAAFVSPPASAAAGAVTPTGTVEFFSGTTSLGMQTLANGKAAITVTAAGVGTQSITFVYSGDANYSSKTSAVLMENVLLTGADVPLIIPTLGTVTLPAQFLAGDKGNVAVNLVNGGGATANGKVSINLYLSPDGSIDSSAIAIAAPAFLNRQVHIASGKTTTLTTHITAGSYPAGSYSLVAQVVPVTTLTTDDISTAPAVSPGTFLAAGLVFGSVGKHHHLVINVTDAANEKATLSLAGAGTGTVTQINGATNVVITGTTNGSRLTIAARGHFAIDDVTVTDSLNSFIARSTTLAGNVILTGGVHQLTVASVASAGGTESAITIGSAFPTTLSLGNVSDTVLTARNKILNLSAASWLAGAVDAPVINRITVTGAFGADLRVHGGGKLQTALIGAVTGGTWTISGGIGTLRVVGDLNNTSIYAGADTGLDDILGTPDDTFANATITTLFVGGTDTSSLVVAGGTPALGQTILTGLALLPKGAIHSITVRGAVSDDSRFLATHLPAAAILAGARVGTKSDPHFVV